MRLISGLGFSIAATCIPCATLADVSPAPLPLESPMSIATPTTPASPTPTPEPARRGQPAPMDAIFPSTDFGGPLIGVNVDPTGYPLEDALYKKMPQLDKARIRVYGWIDAGEEASSEPRGTYPISYNPVSNRPELDQAILRLERDPDTVQRDHSDWGFRLSNLYGVDYRFTTASGYFSDQLLTRNQLNGYDNPEMYAMLYEPKLGQGTVFQLGRVISLPDIEAQLAPQNYLYSHSIMFTFDSYTQTGLFAWTKLSDMFSIDYGIDFGDDIAPWSKSAVFPTGQFWLKYVSKTNRDYLLAGVDAYNNRPFKSYIAGAMPGDAGNAMLGQSSRLYGHDNLQQTNVTWYHIFNPDFHNAFEAYYLYTKNAYVGGTINNGPIQYGGGGGPGAYLPGVSAATGFVDYLEKKISSKDFTSFRLDYLNDPSAWRTGFATSYGSITLGVTHKFTPLTELRPEIRYERNFAGDVTPYNDGTKHFQRTFGVDLIQWF